MKKFTAISAVLLLISMSFAATCAGCNAVESALCEINCIVSGILPVMAFVLFVLAGVAYAAGQFFGAEMRAKAIGWAMNMITGAIIGLVLSAIGPSILTALGGASSFTKCTC